MGEKVSRRDYLKYIGTGVVGLAVGGAIGYFSRAPEVIKEVTTKTETVTQIVTGTPTVTPTTITTVAPTTVVTTVAPTPTALKRLSILNEETDADSVAWLKKAVEAYEKENPYVKIALDSISVTEVWNRITLDIPAGKAAEVVTLPYFGSAVTLATQGFLQPITEVIKAVNEKYKGTEADWAPYSRLVLEGEDYCFPFDVNTMILYVREDYFEEAGIDRAPKTWDEVIEFASLLQKDTDKDGKIDRWGIIWSAGRNNANTEQYIILAWQHGAKFFDDDFNVVLDSPEYIDNAVQALETYKKLTDLSPPGSTGFSWPEMISYFTGGRVAMGRYTGGRLTKRIHADNPAIEDKVKVYPLPQVDPAHPVHYSPQDVFAVVSKSVYPDEGVKFLKWFIPSRHFINFLHTVPTHFTPPIKCMWESEDYRTYAAPGLEDLVNLLNRHFDADKANFESAWYGFDLTCEPGNVYYNPFAGAILGGLQIPDMVQSYLLGKMDARSAVKYGAEEIRKTVESLKATMTIKYKIEAWKG